MQRKSTITVLSHHMVPFLEQSIFYKVLYNEYHSLQMIWTHLFLYITFLFHRFPCDKDNIRFWMTVSYALLTGFPIQSLMCGGPPTHRLYLGGQLAYINGR